MSKIEHGKKEKVKEKGKKIYQPFDIFPDIVYIPNIESPMVKLNHSCLVDAHNFTEVCQCSIDKKENCDIFKKVKPTVHKNENDLEGIFEIGGMQFDQDFFYLPDFNDTFVKLDNECLKMDCCSKFFANR